MHAHRLIILAASAVALSTAAHGAAAQVVTTSGGDVVAFTQKNVVDRLIVGDSIEIEMAQLAVTRTKNDAVRELANQLLTDHRAHLENVRKLAAIPTIGREASVGDTSGASDARVLGQLNAITADSVFDRAFVTEQVNLHKRAIEGLKKLRVAATDSTLQQDIDKTVPVLEQHLTKSQAVATLLAAPPADAAKQPAADSTKRPPADSTPKRPPIEP